MTHLDLAVVANVQLGIEGEGARVHALLGVAGVPAGRPEAAAAHQGVVDVTHHLHHFHIMPDQILKKGEKNNRKKQKRTSRRRARAKRGMEEEEGGGEVASWML